MGQPHAAFPQAWRGQALRKPQQTDFEQAELQQNHQEL